MRDTCGGFGRAVKEGRRRCFLQKGLLGGNEGLWEVNASVDESVWFILWPLMFSHSEV